MEKINQIKSTAVPLDIENIDTDQIIPARFLKATDKKGFGDNLFYDWRYLDEGIENPNFILNNPIFRGEILVSGNNFGCGSSREHATWALKGYGFKAIISSFFADIFKNNALNTGLVPIQVTEQELKDLFQNIKENPQIVIEISLEDQSLTYNNIKIAFPLDSYKKTCLLNGYDDIDYLIGIKDEIELFEDIKYTNEKI